MAYSAFGGMQPRALAAQNPASRANNASNSYGGYRGNEYGNQIPNPFAGRDPTRMDYHMDAQMANWSSAYVGTGGAGARHKYNENNNTPDANTAESKSRAAIMSAAHADTGVAAVVTASDGKKKTVVRSGGGKTWQDPSLLEWDPAHFRLFVGNLAGETTDDSLLKAFSKYPSVQRARVVRDKRTTKSKGYGFVSFVDGDEYFQAARDMQGKYIGSHPVIIRKSTTEIRPTVAPKDPRKASKHKSNSRNQSQSAGVQKKPAKTKGGLKILG